MIFSSLNTLIDFQSGFLSKVFLLKRSPAITGLLKLLGKITSPIRISLAQTFFFNILVWDLN